MKNFDSILLVTAPLQFLMDYKYLTWVISIGTLIWVITRHFIGVPEFYRLSMFFCGLTLFMGLIEIVFLLAWFVFFPKGHLGIPYVVSLWASLPILIPAVLILFFMPNK
jgi:hypothetical protein